MKPPAVSFLLFLLFFPISDAFPFEEGYKHYFTYSSAGQLLGLHNITTIIKFHTWPVNRTADGGLNVLRLDSFVQHSSQGYVQSNPKKWDFSKSFLFYISNNGAVSHILRHPGENDEVLTLKKVLSGTLSMQKKGSEKGEWSYSGWETDHHGRLFHEYTGRKTSEGLVFERKHHSSETAQRWHEKTIHYDLSGRINNINCEDTIILEQDKEIHFERKPTIPGEIALADSSTGEFPTVSSVAKTEVRLTAKRREVPPNDRFYYDLHQDSPEVKMPPLAKQKLTDANGTLVQILKCIHSFTDKRALNRSSCVHDLRHLLDTLTTEDMVTLTQRFLQRKCPKDDSLCWNERFLFIDILARRGDHASQKLILDHVLLQDGTMEEELRRPLFHYVILKNPLLETVDVVERLCFMPDETDKEMTKMTKTQRRACLTLGALAKSLAALNNLTVAERIVEKLESWLGLYNHTQSYPVVNRAKRSVEDFDEERHHHIVTKTILLHSLGNAGMKRSILHIRSYMQPNQGASAWKRAAIGGLRHYECKESAMALFDVLVNEEDTRIRKEAHAVYRKHPRHQDISREKENILLSKNYTYSAVVRVRRSIFEIDFSDGIHLKIEVPGINWDKDVGSAKVGASMGLHINNMLEMKLHPLNSFFKVDADNEAWVEAHVGMINLHVDIVRAKFCYVGHIEYDLNVLKDFGITHFKDLLHIFNQLFKSIVDPIKRGVEDFKQIIKPGYLQSVIGGFVKFVKSLPNLVKSFGSDFSEIVKKSVHFYGHPLAEKIKQISQRIKSFIEEIQTDALEFYHGIADAVTITVPNAGKQLKEVINDIISSVKQLFKSPSQAFSKITEAIMRIQLAISMVIDAKNKVVDACLFAQGNSPFWMNVGEGIMFIIEDIKELIGMVGSITQNIFSVSPHVSTTMSPSDGIISGNKMKQWIQDEMKAMLNRTLIAAEGLRTVADPFFKMFKDAMDFVKSVKNAFEAVKIMIQSGKAQVQKIFGPKFDPKFPSRREKCSDCQCGQWPSTAGGMFSTTGVDVYVREGKQIVNPVAGRVYHEGNNRIVVVPTDNNFAMYDIVIDNIHPYSNVTTIGAVMEAGLGIGTALNSHCHPNFIHVALRVKSELHVPDGDREYADPSKYLDRLIPDPKWIEECNDHVFYHIGQAFDSGGVTEDGAKEIIEDYKSHMQDKMKEFANMEPESEPPYRPVGMDNTDSFKNSFQSALASFKDFGKMLLEMKVPKLDDFIDINTMTVTGLQRIVANNIQLKQILNDVVQNVTTCLRSTPVSYLEGLSHFQLLHLLSDNMVNIVGDRLSLVSALRSKVTEACPALASSIAKGLGHFCVPSADCQGMKCGVVFPFPYFTEALQVDIQTCGSGIKITLPKNTTTVTNNGTSHSINIPLKVSHLKHLKIVLQIQAWIEGNETVVSLKGSVCSEEFGSCLLEVKILNGARFKVHPFRTGPSDDSFMDRINSMTLTKLWSRATLCHIDTKAVLKLITGVRDGVLKELFTGPKQFASRLKEEFKEMKDMCANGNIPIPTTDLTIFPTTRIRFVVGPIPMSLSFGAGGSFGLHLKLGICFLSMSLEAKLTPWAGGKVWGDIAVDIGFARGGLRLVGYLLQTKFPITGKFGFTKFPLDVTMSLDMEMVPLSLVLSAFAELKLLFKTVTVFEGSLWKYSMRSIHRNIFSTSHKGKSSSPPKFQPITVGSRKKRSTPRGCEIHQIPQRDPTDTAFLLEVTSESDTSDLKVFYAIGTQSGGTNVLDWTKLGGNSLTMPVKLPNGIPLHWTVKAQNSEGMEAVTECMLTTYDNTPPDGRVDESYKVSSHPTKLSGTVVVYDDTPLSTHQNIALGLSPGLHGNEIVSWAQISLQKTTQRNDIAGDLRYFSHPRKGKLTAKALKSVSTRTDAGCARQCIDYGLKCVSFGYDYTGQICDLHEVGEGPSAKLRTSGSYESFERLGVGHKYYKEYRDLNLTHGETYFINTEVVNKLGYKSYLSSDGTIIDMTPPEPGPVGQSISDVLRSDKCNAAITQRCFEVTDIQNHRTVTDGEDGQTVFNGHKRLQDERYTLANNLMSANWDGFHDNETGIFGYTWAAGRSVCSSDVVPFSDPHSNLPSRDQWTYTGITSNLALQDGPYYVTVQAINNVVYGGALVTTVCHSTPIIVDTTPPLLYAIDDVFYDEEFDLLALYYNATDPLSKIAGIDFGLGDTKHDVKIQPYIRHEFEESKKPFVLIENFHLNAGIAAWPRIRVTNNVGLGTSGHADAPIIIDHTPPTAGVVIDGDIYRVDRNFQADQSKICGQWKNFYDSESGIEKYSWGVGTSPGSDDIVNFTSENRNVHSACVKVGLHHNSTYYSTVIAFNSALNQKRVNKTSDGVLVDITAPRAGWVNDGNTATGDIRFSSETALVQAVWGGFRDQESGIDHYKVDVHVNNQKVKTLTVKSKNEMTEKTLQLKHGDRVFSKLSAYNGAGTSVDVSSNGFVIDLTPPITEYVRDTDALNHYQTDDTSLSLSWKFFDIESGIMQYRLSVYEEFQNQKKMFWPPSGRGNIFHGQSGTEVKFRLTNQTLENGAKYSAEVVAVNGAKMSKLAKSRGVIIDVTPPNVQELHIGPIKEDEEIENGKILHADHSNLLVTWLASDAESGIEKVFVAVGTSPNDYTVTNGYMVFHSTHEAYLHGLDLQASDKSGHFYYVHLKVENVAGLQSKVLVSKPISVLPANVPGIVYDGRENFVDINFMHDKSSFGMSFAGFKSVACGIIGYEWGVGTDAFKTDVVPFTSFGIVQTNQSSGFGQMDIKLFEGVTYYATVRARTGHNCHEHHIVSSSNGVTVDTQGPTVHVRNGAGTEVPSITKWTTQYQNFTDTISLYPDVFDEFGINKSWVCVGSNPYETNIKPCQQSNIAQLNGLSLHGGQGVFVSVISQDMATNKEIWESSAIIPDTTPPFLEELLCTELLSLAKTEIMCHWKAVREYESQIQSMKLCLGFGQDTCDPSTYENIPLQKTKWRRDLLDYLKNSTYDIIYITVFLVNSAGGKRTFMKEVVIDRTAPEPGIITFVTDDRISPRRETKLCQVPQSYVEMKISGFKDPETGMDWCEIALGHLKGTADVYPFTRTEPGGIVIITSLSLRKGDLVYATIRCFNKAGLSTVAMSDSVGVSPNPRLSVSDGIGKADKDYQSSLSSMEGQWAYSEPCPIFKAEWKVETIDRRIVQDFTTIHGADFIFYSDELQLTAGVTYRNVIRVTDALNRTRVSASDGVTVFIEPPYPGTVRDGKNEDVDYQESTNALFANWDQFGIANSSDPTQQIVQYEVAVGDDIRYQNSQTNIRDYVNVFLNTFYTFKNLSLEAKSKTYYITVRAHSKAGGFEESRSDGVRVGFSPNIISGQIEFKKFVDSVSTLTFSWSDFYSDIGVDHYEVAVSESNPGLPNSTFACSYLRTFNETFAHNFSSVGRGNVAELRSLNLKHSVAYFVTVLAIDKLHACSASVAGPITVDTTPPVAGEITIMGGTGPGIFYVTSSEKVNVRWKAFTDRESGIVGYQVTLSLHHPCSAIKDEKIISVWVTNSTETTFYNLNLNDGASYIIKIVAFNNAGRNTSAVSLPFLIDKTPPSSGTVKVGHDWHKTFTFQSEKRHVEAMAAFASSEKARECLKSVVILPSNNQRGYWSQLDSNFSSDAVLVTKEMVRVAVRYDETLTKIIKGGVYRNLGGPLQEGNYTLEIKTVSGEQMVTTVLIIQHASASAVPAIFPDLPEVQTGDPPTHSLNSSSNMATSRNLTSSSTSDKDTCLTVNGIGHFIYGYQNSQNKWLSRICVKDDVKVSEQWIELSSNPATSFHTHTFAFSPVIDGIRESWKLSVYIDGKWKVDFTGLSFVKEPSLLFAATNKDNHKPPLVNVLEPFFTQAVLKRISVPESRDKDCLHGDPIFDKESSLKEIWVGISSNINITDDVMPYRLLKSFCLPCVDACQEMCDVNCPIEQSRLVFTPFHLEIDNITLEASESGKKTVNTSDFNSFKAPTYYLNILSYNYAGLRTVSVSNAFQVDTTPPKFTYVRCVDPSHTLDEPTDFIATNNSIGAFWECDEDVGEISRYYMAVGSSMGQDDIYNYTSVELQKKVGIILEESLLLDNVTYFVTITAENSAGLRQSETCNVTVMLGGPKVSRTYSRNMFTYLYAQSTGAALTSSQTKVGLEVNGGPDVMYYDWRMGTTADHDDFFPEIKAATGPRAHISIEHGELQLDGDLVNISLADYAKQNSTNTTYDPSDDSTFLLLEPGRCYYHTLNAVGRSRVATNIPTQPICVKRDADLILDFKDSSVRVVGGSNGNLQVTTNIKELMSLKAIFSIDIDGHNGSMIVGRLHQHDLRALYGSAATAKYVPYITDPGNTQQQTSRLLFGRLKRYLGLSFFISPATVAQVSGKAHANIPYNLTDMTSEEIPALLVWNKERQLWEYTENVCSETQTRTSAGILHAAICPVEYKQHQSLDVFRQPQHFAVFAIGTRVINTAPIFVTKHLSLEEDSDLYEPLEVYDRESDTVLFQVVQSPKTGVLNVSFDGSVTFKPYPDTCGHDIFEIYIAETTVPNGVNPYAFTSQIDVDIHCINDPPRLEFITTSNISYDSKPNEAVAIKVIASDGSTRNKVFLGLMALTDVDIGDSLYLIHDEKTGKQLQLEVKTPSSETLHKYGFASSSTGSMTRSILEIWVGHAENDVGKHSVKFIARDQSFYHSNPIILEISVEKVPCSGSRCYSIDTKGISRNKEKLFNKHFDPLALKTTIQPTAKSTTDKHGQLITPLSTPSNKPSRPIILDFSETQQVDVAMTGNGVLIKGPLPPSLQGLITISIIAPSHPSGVVVDTWHLNNGRNVPYGNGSNTLSLNSTRLLQGRIVTTIGRPLSLQFQTQLSASTEIIIRGFSENGASGKPASPSLLYLDKDGYWQETSGVCPNQQNSDTGRARFLVVICPELLKRMVQKDVTSNSMWIAKFSLFELKKGLENTPPALKTSSLKIIQDHSLSRSLEIIDAEGDAATITLAKSPLHGFAALDSTGQFFYRPFPHFVGQDQVHFTLHEYNLPPNVTPFSVSTVLHINVTKTNDPRAGL